VHKIVDNIAVSPCLDDGRGAPPSTGRTSQVVAAVEERTSISASGRTIEVANHTVLQLPKDLGCAAAALHDVPFSNSRTRGLRVAMSPPIFSLSQQQRSQAAILRCARLWASSNCAPTRIATSGECQITPDLCRKCSVRRSQSLPSPTISPLERSEGRRRRPPTHLRIPRANRRRALCETR